MGFLCCVLSGCSVLQNGIREYSSDKEQCHLVSEDVTQFTYKGEAYTILDNTVSNDGLGEWLGYIRQLAAVDEDGTVCFRKRLKPPLLKPCPIWQIKPRTPNTSSRF